MSGELQQVMDWLTSVFPDEAAFWAQKSRTGTATAGTLAGALGLHDARKISDDIGDLISLLGTIASEAAALDVGVQPTGAPSADRLFGGDGTMGASFLEWCEAWDEANQLTTFDGTEWFRIAGVSS
jgi:hypothetical protein